MTRAQALLTLLSAIVGLLIAMPARAVFCTINGTVTLQSQDSYYCDTGVLPSGSCSNWLETDLDSTTVKMQYMYVGVGLSYTSTDANGNWSLTFPLNESQCAGNEVEIRYYFARVHEDDVGQPYPRFRFAITDIDETGPMPGLTWRARSVVEPLGGPTTNVTCTWSRTSTVSHARWANIYYTANSFLKEVTQWSSNLDSSFSTPFDPFYSSSFLRIGVESTSPFTGLAQGPYAMIFHSDAYAAGAAIRHELGHIVQRHVHGRDRDWSCESYKFNGHDNHDPQGCDYAPAAITEGFATFVATRSITRHDTKSWFCSCVDAALGSQNWDICSDKAVLSADPDGDDDWFFKCGAGVSGDFWWLGDYHIKEPSDCVELRTDRGCDCTPDSGVWCNDTYRLSHGYRNEVQVSRFFWDMIDTNNDNAMDDTGTTGDFNRVQIHLCMGVAPLAHATSLSSRSWAS